MLQDPGIGGFEVRTLLNAPAHEVNLAVEEFFADRQPDDLLLVHFSCHGVKDEDGELYFAMANTLLRRLGATAVAAEFVNRRMSRSRSRRVVLLLDCCYAGAFERGMTARAGTEMGIESQFGGRGRAVITASSAMEYAFEGDQLADTRELAPSVFTSALVEGLETGDADRDQDGLVALDELYDYIYDKVRAATPNQTPGKWTFGVQGELVIARRARRSPRPRRCRPSCRRRSTARSPRSAPRRSRNWHACWTAGTPGWRWPPGWPWNGSPRTTAAPWPPRPPRRSAPRRSSRPDKDRSSHHLTLRPPRTGLPHRSSPPLHPVGCNGPRAPLPALTLPVMAVSQQPVSRGRDGHGAARSSSQQRRSLRPLEP